MSYFAKIRVIAMKKLTETILNLVFPPKCPFCGKVLDAVGVCPPCEKALPWIPEEQAALSEGDLTCAAPLWYEGNVREALLRLKFRGGSALAEPFGELLARCAAERFGGEFDTVTWVPVSQKRLETRGYDQSRLLAEAVCRCFGSMEDLLRGLRQTSLSDQREGYTWLLSDRCGRLRLLFTPGQATALPLFPLLCLDLYRHAYALTYGNDRTAYVEAALPLINWEALSQRYKIVYTAQPPFPNP